MDFDFLELGEDVLDYNNVHDKGSQNVLDHSLEQPCLPDIRVPGKLDLIAESRDYNKVSESVETGDKVKVVDVILDLLLDNLVDL